MRWQAFLHAILPLLLLGQRCWRLGSCFAAWLPSLHRCALVHGLFSPSRGTFTRAFCYSLCNVRRLRVLWSASRGASQAHNTASPALLVLTSTANTSPLDVSYQAGT